MSAGPLCTSQNSQCSFPPFAGKLTVIFQTRSVETPDRRHPTGCVSSNLSLSRRLLNRATAASLQCCLLLCAILLSTQRHFVLMQISRRSYVHNDTWDGLPIIVSLHVSVLGCFCWALAFAAAIVPKVQRMQLYLQACLDEAIFPSRPSQTLRRATIYPSLFTAATG